MQGHALGDFLIPPDGPFEFWSFKDVPPLRRRSTWSFYAASTLEKYLYKQIQKTRWDRQSSHWVSHGKQNISKQNLILLLDFVFGCLLDIDNWQRGTATR